MKSIQSTVASALVAAMAVASVVAQGCSFTSNTTAIQCTSEAECLGMGPEFANTTCDPATKTCKKVAAPVECATSAECGTKAPGTVCRRSKCVPVLTDECTAIRGRQEFLLDDDALVIGAITPFEAGAELGDAIEHGGELAQRQIAPASTGTGIPMKSGKTRPVVIVSCREFSNPGGLAALQRAAEHLVKDLEVPVVLGPIDPTNAQIVATNVTVPNKVLNITTAVSSSLDALNPVGQPPLLLRTNWSDREALLTLQPFLEKWLVPRLKADGMLRADGTEDLRIAIVAEGDYKGIEGARIVTDKLTWNVKKPEEGGDGTPANCAWNQSKKTPSACRSSDFGSLADLLGNPTPEGKIAGVLAPLLKAHTGGEGPHVILHSYAVYGIPRIFFPLEDAWEDSYDSTLYPNGRPDLRPYHIGLFPPFNTFTPLWSFMDVEAKKTGRRGPVYIPPQKRLFAFDARPDQYLTQDLITEFGRQYGEAFDEFRNNPTATDLLVRLFYDSVYLAAYATAALGDKPLTGANLAEAVQTRINKAGERILSGPGDIQKAFATLNQGLGINFDGLSGNLDFNAQGSVEYTVEMMCPGRAPDGSTTDTVPAGFYYDVETGTVVGDTAPQAQCPFLQ